jgi:hypothetical protein
MEIETRLILGDYLFLGVFNAEFVGVMWQTRKLGYSL